MSQPQISELKILVQSREDIKDLLSTQEKVNEFPEGMTAVFMEAATKGGQLGIEFIIKARDFNGNMVLTSYVLTENNMEALMGAFLGVRMRFGRMPLDQYEMVRHYIKEQVRRFLGTLSPDVKALVDHAAKRFFGIVS